MAFGMASFGSAVSVERDGKIDLHVFVVSKCPGPPTGGLLNVFERNVHVTWNVRVARVAQ